MTTHPLQNNLLGESCGRNSGNLGERASGTQLLLFCDPQRQAKEPSRQFLVRTRPLKLFIFSSRSHSPPHPSLQQNRASLFTIALTNTPPFFFLFLLTLPQRLLDSLDRLFLFLFSRLTQLSAIPSVEVTMVRNIVVLGGNSHPQLVENICNILGIPASNRILTKFSGGETRFVTSHLDWPRVESQECLRHFFFVQV